MLFAPAAAHSNRMNQDHVLSHFRETEALLEGHFLLSSGLHSPTYLQCALALQYPSDAAKFGRAIAERLQNSPPVLGGVAAAPADGVVAKKNQISPNYHPASQSLGTPPKQGGEPWNPYDVVGHLIHGEETDWIPRARIILAQGDNRTFVPFDRFAQFEKSKGRSLAQLLDEFAKLRVENIETLRSWNLTDAELDLEAIHPELGPVTLRQLLATWVVHDLNHIRQIVTAMAGKYASEVGVWREYLSILQAP